LSSALFMVPLNAFSPNFFPGDQSTLYQRQPLAGATSLQCPVHGLLERVETPASRRQFSE
jgi:hypothetical protein